MTAFGCTSKPSLQKRCWSYSMCRYIVHLALFQALSSTIVENLCRKSVWGIPQAIPKSVLDEHSRSLLLRVFLLLPFSSPALPLLLHSAVSPDIPAVPQTQPCRDRIRQQKRPEHPQRRLGSPYGYKLRETIENNAESDPDANAPEHL